MYFKVAFGLALLEVLLLPLTLLIGLPALILLVCVPFAWLAAIVRSIVSCGPRGLALLVSAPLVVLPPYGIWYLSNGCPGGGVCL